MRKEGIDRRFLLASARAAESAARIAAEAPEPIDLVVVSPTELARESVPVAVGDRWVFTIEEPLLAPRVPGESGDDVIARVAQALRGVRAYDAGAPLVIFDSLVILGASVFVLDEHALARTADRLEALLPLP
jgi:broad specificity phosphatase PhoE